MILQTRFSFETGLSFLTGFKGNIKSEKHFCYRHYCKYDRSLRLKAFGVSWFRISLHHSKA